ncbi:MAG: hypothetical protein JWO82_274, partial [Akkermansiaceae bacterium]|nr:hypothetical protein [Akkermansiaceae bacterium]
MARTALPAVAGIGLGMGIFHQGGSDPGVAGETGPKSGPRRTEARPAPERDGPLASADPQAALLAAYGGRTKEAKRHLEELLATAETTDAEIARWLAPVLIEEPGYLEIFLKRLTPERGKRLTCETLFQMDRVDARALWTLVRASPPALAAMHGWTDPAAGLERNDKMGVDDLLAHSEGREEVLLDPAHGFRDAELREGCWKLKDAESLGKLLELSKLGRLEEAEAGLPNWLLGSLGEVSQSD